MNWDEARVPIALMIALTGAVFAMCVVLCWAFWSRESERLRDMIERERRNQAKREIDVQAKSGWAALMAQRCPYCCGSGIELTADATAWLDKLDSEDVIPDEPDWDVGDCDFCDGAGVIGEEHRAKMLDLLSDMRGKKLKTPFDAALGGGLK
jgi:hypothetical protein